MERKARRNLEKALVALYNSAFNKPGLIGRLPCGFKFIRRANAGDGKLPSRKNKERYIK